MLLTSTNFNETDENFNDIHMNSTVLCCCFELKCIIMNFHLMLNEIFSFFNPNDYVFVLNTWNTSILDIDRVFNLNENSTCLNLTILTK